MKIILTFLYKSLHSYKAAVPIKLLLSASESSLWGWDSANPISTLADAPCKAMSQGALRAERGRETLSVGFLAGSVSTNPVVSLHPNSGSSFQWL